MSFFSTPCTGDCLNLRNSNSTTGVISPAVLVTNMSVASLIMLISYFKSGAKKVHWFYEQASLIIKMLDPFAHDSFFIG